MAYFVAWTTMLLVLPLLTVIEPASLVRISAAGLPLTGNVRAGSVELFLKAPPTPKPNPRSVPTIANPPQRNRTTRNAIKQPNHGLVRLGGATAGPA